MTASRGRLAAAAVLVIAAALVSTLLLFQHHGEPGALSGAEAVCGPGSGCDTVAQSPYARFAGVPLAAWGLLFYGSIAVLLLMAAAAEGDSATSAAGLAFYGLALALILDVVLLALQAFVIKAYCALCLATYVLGGLALAALLPARRALPRALLGPAARTILAGWIVGTVALAGLALAAEAALTARERVRAVSILGGTLDPEPAPTAAPMPTAQASVPPDANAPATASPATPAAADSGAELDRYREAAHAAEEQARRLQEILDDPRKLDQYFADKALAEFERSPVRDLQLDGVPHKGPADASIKVVEYSDFLCPYCRSLAAAFNDFLPRTSNRLALFFKNYPLDKECNPGVSRTVHPGACWLALGAVCAQEQGRFWPYHDKVFSTDLHQAAGPDAVRLATEAGLDQSAMEACLVSERAKQRLAADIGEAARAGVQATPTLFVNGKQLPRINDFVNTLNKEAARLGLPPFPKSED